MFETEGHVGHVRAVCVDESALEPRNYVVAKFADCDPLDPVDLDSVEANSRFILSKLAAIEYVKYFVAFRFGRRPVMDQQPPNRSVQTQFFAPFRPLPSGLQHSLVLAGRGVVMAWFVLTDGIPREPSYDELLAGQDQPQPHSFLRRLFQELAGIALTAGTELVREKHSYVENARGYCGAPNVGYAWESSIPVNDTSLPVDETYVTYGLPGVTLIWSVAYRKRGQLGYATWTGQGLSVRMTGHTPDVMDRVWTEVLGTNPVFVPVPQQDEQKYENAARQREEQLRADLKARTAAP